MVLMYHRYVPRPIFGSNVPSIVYIWIMEGLLFSVKDPDEGEIIMCEHLPGAIVVYLSIDTPVW